MSTGWKKFLSIAGIILAIFVTCCLLASISLAIRRVIKNRKKGTPTLPDGRKALRSNRRSEEVFKGRIFPVAVRGKRILLQVKLGKYWIRS